jgi:hypothetical protein
MHAVEVRGQRIDADGNILDCLRPDCGADAVQ